jgi:hypothetical protein
MPRIAQLIKPEITVLSITDIQRVATLEDGTKLKVADNTTLDHLVLRFSDGSQEVMAMKDFTAKYAFK